MSVGVCDSCGVNGGHDEHCRKLKKNNSKSASVMGSKACANRRAAIIVGVDCSNDDADTLTLEFPKGLISGVKTDDPVEVLYFTYKP